jgi:hypothetical protein
MASPHEDRQIVLAWCLVAPLLISWGLGTTHPALDLLAAPAALVLGVPGMLGAAGCALVIVVIAAGERSRGADRVLAVWGGLALLAHALAATRPLPWVALLFGVTAGLRRQPSAWPEAGRGGTWLGAAAWAAAALVRPWGPGVPEGVLTVVGRAADAALPVLGGEIPVVLLIVLIARFLTRRRSPDLRGALLGGAAGLAVVAMFGGQAWGASAAALGMLVGAWPIPVTAAPQRLLPALLVVCALASLRLGATERWRCEASFDEPSIQYFSRDANIQSIAVVPGNLPYLVLLREGGGRLERLAATGIVSESVDVDPPGGILLSSGAYAPIVRAVSVGDHLRVEWWDAALLERVGSVDVAESCDPVGGQAGRDGLGAVVVCADGALIRVGSEGGVEVDSGARAVATARGDFVLRSGAFASVSFRSSDRAPVGPWTAGVGQTPRQLLIARGPAGQLEIRGSRPRFGGAVADVSAAMRTALDRVRVGIWPGTPHYSALQDAVYVTSPIDGRIWLVDPTVTWHQASVRLGPPPRQAIVDAASGTLYGVHRCGLFQVRMGSVFPWRSTGDLEAHETATEVPLSP